MKRIKYTILLLLLAFPLSANPFCCERDPCSPFNGFYVGISGGLALNHADTKIDSFVVFPGAFNLLETLVLDTMQDIYDYRGWGEIFAGWGRQCGCFYLGGRFGVNFSNFSPQSRSLANNLDPDDEVNFAILTNTLETELRNVEYTLDFKPGWVFCNQTMLFGILGAAFNEEELKGTSRFDFDGTPTNNGTALNILKARKKKCSTGFRAGIGMEHMLSRCMSLQLSYVYTDYWTLRKRVEGEYFSSVPEGPFPQEAAFKTDARKQVVSLGLAYYF